MAFRLVADFRRLLHAASAIAAIGGALLAAAPSRAEAPAQKAEIEKIVHDYLIANPEVIRDAIEELERRQKVAEADTRSRAVDQSSDKLFNSAAQAVVGNPAGDVTLVEFFDYNCGYCKRALEDLAKLVDSDPKLRVVLKDFPVLGPGSTEAAEIATALRLQLKPDKFYAFHRKLLTTRGSIGKAQALAVAKELGADTARLEKDMKSDQTHAALKETAELADSLNLTGTPSWVVGKEVIVGAVGYQQLKTKIDNTRKCGKTVC
ncbi:MULTISPECIES: DsbA family protein [Methylosinus]|uniref:Disulfide bond formation protein DsbA n=1 Tax=Methylosinus trichosporium (strain ATCC 35070 / NCIMB 11131 / UNIQEM 75 / OB3b) TaxID=595536 RepID=A0A2D2D5B7_METT3|nr:MULTISPECIES: DsbA family protein [Methylosinus]ATQ70231.1 disulfide bond formation protein DsbA [Methylosinus trichosporium OB3b]OBS50691.1 disulfide bond formation protein DsbA [Methylosinus sp. 3S-1]